MEYLINGINLPTYIGSLVAAVIILLFSILLRTASKDTVVLVVDRLYETMYDFFSSILEENEMTRVKSFITNMFFVVLLFNILGLLTDFVAPIFGYDQTYGEFFLSGYVGYGTADPHFNIAMAIIGVLLSLWIQLSVMPTDSLFGFKTRGSGGRIAKVTNFLYEYIPFWGKGIITIEQGKMPAVVYYPAWTVVKAFDIVISLFVGFLDIVGLFAKVISLAFRLFGNMISGTALLTVLVVGLSATTLDWFGAELPILAPILLFLQGLLVACIQAFVFPLLIAIFIKVARMSEDMEAPT